MGMFALGAVCAWLVLSLLCVPALCIGLSAIHRDERNRLRVALGRLTRAVQHNAAALADATVNEALRLARGELER